MENINKTSKKNVKIKNPLIYVFIYIAVAMLIAVVMKFVMKEDEPVSIAENSGQEFYLSGDYENAVTEYSELQAKEKWPQYTMEIAKTYSACGDYTKSNEYIEKAYEMRNNAIDKDGKDKYKDMDVQLLNDILVTSMINGDIEKTISYAEVFVNDYPDNKQLLKTVFMAYLSNNNISKAKGVLSNYNAENGSSTEIAIGAKMNALLDQYEESFDLLAEAFNKDNTDIAVFDILEQIYNEDKNQSLQVLKELSEKNEDENIYKLFLAKIYSLDESNYEEADKYLKEIERKYSSNVNYMFIQAEILKNTEPKESKKILNNIYEENDDNYIGLFAKAECEYNMGNYEEALNCSKESILLNKDYAGNYSIMIPKILAKKEKKNTNTSSNNKANTNMNKGETQEQYLLIAIEKEPYNYNLILRMADYYSNVAMDSTKALYYYELASEIKRDNSDVLYNMACIKINMQRNDEAYDLLEQGAEKFDKDSRFHRALGALYLQEEKNEKAIIEIRKAYKINKNDILNLNNAGCYYIAIENNTKRSLTNLKAAYDGIGDDTSSDEIKIITDNYNRVKVLDKNNKSVLTLADFKLFY